MMKRSRDDAFPNPSTLASRAAKLNSYFGFVGAPKDCLGSTSEADLDRLTVSAPIGEKAVGDSWQVVWDAIWPHESPLSAAQRSYVMLHEPFAEPLMRELGADAGRGEFETLCKELNSALFLHPSSGEALLTLQRFYNETIKLPLARISSVADQNAYLATVEYKALEGAFDGRNSDRAATPLRKLLADVRLLRSRVFSQISNWEGTRTGGSHGRFFSKIDILGTVASYTRPLIDVDTVFVDFSCGYNNFGPLLGQRKWVGYDIFPPRDREGADPAHFRLKNYFDVERLPGSPTEQAEALVGLNPPFGPYGDTASKFLLHTIAMQQPPRLMALIIPADTPALALIVWETKLWLRALAGDARVQSLPPQHGKRLTDLYKEARATGCAVDAALRAAHVDPRLVLIPPPRWVVISYRDNVCTGLAFEQPGGSFSIANKDPPVFVVLSRGDAIVHPGDAVDVARAARPLARKNWEYFLRDTVNAATKRRESRQCKVK